LLTASFYLEDVSFVNDIVNDNLTIQTRYNSEDLPCTIEMLSDTL
jgi:Predicted tRNA(5-methylaminomethyl-2-thiouridylate) methyltransferase, contains the PP-loop ATPase domain